MRAAIVIAVIAAFATGCGHVPVKKRFEGYRTDIHDRTGQPIEWINVTAPESEVVNQVEAMLRDNLTGEEAVHIALLNNRRMQAMYAEFGIALADLKQAGLPENPMANVAVLFQEDSTFNLRDWDVSIMQDFLSILLIPLRKRLAAAEFERAKMRVTGEVVDLTADTRIAFYRAQAAQQRLELARTVLVAEEASMEMALRLFEAGNMNYVDALNERARYERTKLREAEAEMDVVERREDLNRLMGLWGSATMWRISTRLPNVLDEEVDLEHVEQRVVDANLDLAISWLDLLAVARRNRIRAIDTVIPELQIGVELERETEIETEIGENSAGEPELERSEGPDLWWRGPSVSFPVPIFDQGFPARTRRRMVVRQAWDRFTATAIEVRAEARTARYRLAYARDAARYYENVVLPLQHRLRAQTQLQYNAMFLGVFRLIDAKRQEVEAGRRYIDTLCDYWIARAEFQQMLMGRVPMNRDRHESRQRNGMDSQSDGGPESQESH